jgi:hypothetical protein
MRDIAEIMNMQISRGHVISYGDSQTLSRTNCSYTINSIQTQPVEDDFDDI